MVVCDVTRPLTTKSVTAWKKVRTNDSPWQLFQAQVGAEAVRCAAQVLDEKVLLPNGDPIPVVLIANKTDLLKAAHSHWNTCINNNLPEIIRIASAHVV